MKPIHILNLGAGVQSTVLALMSHKGHSVVPKFDVAIFADTGDEPDSVYAHLEWIIKEVKSSFPVMVRRRCERSLGDSLVLGVNARSKRFASIPAFIKMPSGDVGITRRQCTADFKVLVVEQCIRREVLGLAYRQRWPKEVDVHQYFGLSFEEGRRVARVKSRMIEDGRCTPHFPLFDLRATRKDCVAYLEKYPVPHMVPRSACVFCPYKSNVEWRLLRDTDPKGWSRAVEIDTKIRAQGSNVNKALVASLYLHRSCVPLAEANIEAVVSNATQYEFGLVNECEGMCGL